MKTPRFTDALGHSQSDKRIDILRGIGRSGSISQAARDASVSYKAAWQAIDTLTNLAGVPLVERAVGGAGGGGASLTPQGVQLLELSEALDVARTAVQQRWRDSLGAGAIAAGVDADRVAELGVTRLALRTSMRNQLPAIVAAIDTTGPISRVVLQLGNDAAVTARITRESTELLGLVVGIRVVALCKATAVRVCRADDAVPAAHPSNRIDGRVTSMERGESGDEVSLVFSGGVQLVGFAGTGSGLRVRGRVTAEIDEASLVVALAA
ncbi:MULTISPECIES: TOBE domain-containing protein [unclassified Variovorax]|jgi:molybdate transport system regulatory protein|uniref:TOBE domain-containing protein n=1 Tax=unclassified Variovorax TaxID=663243 RepID=UPI002B22653F|nr:MULTISPECIES: TOBE domain-containing protein [unclassified Variovorax]MEB0058142.1 TOBE domain-containing protein [Variovorax sp. LG9.2]MEB0112141.1 TOBE domain-containing protein [Variovorax sp. RTB1]